MIKMVFKKIWYQRRGNSWLIIESFIVFILFCLLVDLLHVTFTPIVNSPIGYSINKVYDLKLAKDNSIITDESTQESVLRIIRQIERSPAVEAVTVYYGAEHFSCYSSMHMKNDSIEDYAQFFSVDEDYFDIFNVEIEEDGGIFPWKEENGEPKIIFTQAASKHFFKDRDPIGEKIDGGRNLSYGPSTVSYRISGLIKKTKHLPSNDRVEYLYCYTTLPEDYIYDTYTSIAFRIKDGISYEEFENKMMDDFKKLLVAGAVYPESLLSFKQIKKDSISSGGDMTYGIILIVGLLFFIFNIFISTFATFHFRINKRKEEIGLKLSIGATRRTLMKELIFEGVMILTLAVIPAIIIIVNLYYLEIGWISDLPITFLRVLGCTSVTYLVLVMMVALGTWLPARRVMKIEPAIALKEE